VIGDHPLKDFREAGSPSAPITCEIYSDYQCPLRRLLPRDHAAAGGRLCPDREIRILHRNLPLPQHPYARLAARHANAAGRLGQYDAVVKQLFATQHLWEATGEIDTQVAQVLQPGLRVKVRDLVMNDQEA
jgi:protein-disulfide isomerase